MLMLVVVVGKEYMVNSCKQKNPPSKEMKDPSYIISTKMNRNQKVTVKVTDQVEVVNGKGMQWDDLACKVRPGGRSHLSIKGPNGFYQNRRKPCSLVLGRRRRRCVRSWRRGLGKHPQATLNLIQAADVNQSITSS